MTDEPDFKLAKRRKAEFNPPLRQQPHSLESEQYVLGCVLLSPVEALALIAEKLTLESFHDLRNQVIYKAFTDLADASKPINTISLYQKLKDDGTIDQVGGLPYINEFQDVAVSVAGITQFIEIVEEKWILRKLLTTCAELTESVYSHSGDVNALLDTSERKMLAIRPAGRQGMDIKGLVNGAINELEHRAMNPDVIFGLETGLIDLDKLSDGVHDGELIVVAGYPSTGKTALAVNVATHNALKGIPIAIFSAEMLPVKIAIRQLCGTAKVNAKRICEGDIPRMVVAAGRISKAPIHIEPANGMTIGQITAMARRLKQKNGTKLIVVDYIQILQGTGETKEQRIASISSGLKSIAMELGCPVIALSQLTDDGKLRDSRAIGMDADSIWKLENEGEWQPKIQPINLNVEKCRDGETGQVQLVFMKEYTRFESVSRVME